MAKRKQNSFADALRLLGSKGVDAAAAGDKPRLLRAVVEHVDAAVVGQKTPFDKRDSVRDRLFALLMQHMDVVQAQRAAYLNVLQYLCRNPADARHIGQPLFASLQNILRQAGAPASPAHVGALALALLTILAAWRNDTTADLSKTMKACDKALGVLENVARFV
ncbi:MAG: hypothetical protein AB7G06_01455 [Bdellovibrionales bacterium]